MKWYDDVPLEIRAMILLQGGGTRGAYFPGMLDGLSSHGIRRYYGFAGSSAGALVATGLWAGLSPRKLNDFLVNNSGKFGILNRILSTQEVFSYLVSMILWIPMPGRKYINIVYKLIRNIGNSKNRNRQDDLDLLPGIKGARFQKFISDMIKEGLKERGFHKEIIEHLFGVSYDRFDPTFRNIHYLSKWVEIVNSIDSVTHPDFHYIEETLPNLAARIAKDPKSYFSDPSPNSSNNFIESVFGEGAAKDPFFMPLFMSACNITDMEAVFFNNVEIRYADIPISKMARASAGHPAVFRPARIKTADDIKKQYTDGGIIYNYPAVALEEYLRNLARYGISNLFKEEEGSDFLYDYTPILKSTYIIIGFSTDERDGGKSYYRKIIALVTGSAKALIERDAAKKIPYMSQFCAHCDDKIGTLSFHKLTKKYFIERFSKGRDFVSGNKEIISSSFFLRQSDRDVIQPIIESMMEMFEGAFREYVLRYKRCHLFAETRDTEVNPGKFSKIGYYSQSKESFDDERISFRQGHGGIVGMSGFFHAPALARADLLQEMRKERPNTPILDLSWNDVQHMPKDLNFIISIPIFDTLHVQITKPNYSYFTFDGFEKCLRIYDTGLVGPIIGVLAFDASIEDIGDIDDVSSIFTDSGLRHALERGALDIGHQFAQNIVDKMILV